MANAAPRKLHNVRLHCTISNQHAQSQFNLHVDQMCDSEENGKTFSWSAQEESRVFPRATRATRHGE